MNFLLDAQLPRRLAVRLRKLGHDAIHTLDLPRANQTTDLEISELSVRETRVVVTKDSDFVDSLLLRGQPWKLLLVTTGNINNRELEALVLANLETVINGLAQIGATLTCATRPPQKIARLSKSFDTWVNHAQSVLSTRFSQIYPVTPQNLLRGRAVAEIFSAGAQVARFM